MSIILQHVTYSHADNEILFHDISLSVNKGEKVALTGNNGTGKSTLLQIISGKQKPSTGNIDCSDTLYYIPQHFGQYDDMTIAEALGINRELKALKAITKGDASTENFMALNDRWDIEEQALSALAHWGLNEFPISRKIASLSGGEKTKIFLSGMMIHHSDIILMDEPTNHLDSESRKKLYEFIHQSKATILIVSHDRMLLSQMSYIYELHRNGITAYGGNYEFYKTEKEKNINLWQGKLESMEKELRMARKETRAIAERKDKHDVRGKKTNIKKGISKMAMNAARERAEISSSKQQGLQTERQEKLRQNLTKLKEILPDISQMKINFNPSSLHTGKVLISTEGINFGYETDLLWKHLLTFQIKSGDRIAIEGENGTGKTTLIKLITGILIPTKGILNRAEQNFVYIDQEYSLIDNRLSVYEQAQYYNARILPEHELKMILNRFLFPLTSWNKPCSILSGGEKMRLGFCCLMIANNKPDIFILDEPTNNIDIQNIEIITTTIKDYKGTILVVSHDSYFKKEIGIRQTIRLERNN